VISDGVIKFMKTKRALTCALLTFLAIRILTSMGIVLASMVTPPNPPPALWDPAVVNDLEQRSEWVRLLVMPWYRWDTAHYLQIADLGYKANMENTVWPPLFPALIRLFNAALQPPLLATLVVTNLAAIGALFLLYLLVSDVWGETRAGRVLVWTAVFPTGFFLLAGYTESLFLLFAVGALLAARRHQWWLAGLAGALASLTRIPGVLLAAPILWEAWGQFRICRGRERLYNTLHALAATSLLPLSLGLFSLYVHDVLGADWPWNSLSANWHLHFAMPWTGIFGNLELMSHENLSLNTVSQFYDAFLAIWAVILLIYGIKHIPFSFTIYAVVMIIPALTKILDNNTLMSVSRYLLPIFPLFVSQDQFFRDRGVRAFWAFFFLASQGLLLYMFYKWVWVA
jgi:hypothetical protein